MTVRYFNSTPHTVHFGSHDDDQSWMMFWRNGVRFEITVNHAEVQDTRFGRKWSNLHETDDHTTEEEGSSLSNRWELQSDCLIFQCLDLLEQVAPDQEHWQTYRDYLHTSGYKIKVIVNEEAGEAEGQLEDGCIIHGAYESSPLPAEEIGIATHDLTEYRSKDLYLEFADLNCSPRRAWTRDGKFFGLEHVEGYGFYVDTGEILNGSFDTITMRLNIHQHCLEHPLGYPSRIPQVLGYVTDDTDPSENREEDKNRLDAGLEELFSGSEPRTLIASLVLTDCPSFRSLWDVVRDSKDDNDLLQVIKTNQELWKSQTLAIVRDLHARGMACTEANDSQESTINDNWVNIDHDQHVWLDPRVKFFKTSVRGTAAQFEQVKAKDLNATHRLFDEWLPAEIDEVERHQIKRKFNI